jgi:ribosomal protein S18 acetylase RimI-like enzyme
MAQLVLYQQTRLPSTEELRDWLRQLARAGYTRVRTSALATTAGLRVESVGFGVVQELVLLEHPDPRSAPAPRVGTGRLLVAQHAAASDIDRAAFGEQWSLDPGAIGDVCNATPRHRARATGGSRPTAYAITGRDSRQGFLQRLAVDPSHHRQGLGTALVLDSLRWSARWRVQRVLVNTPIDNDAALSLYARTGFHRLPDRLRVYERVLP